MICVASETIRSCSWGTPYGKVAIIILHLQHHLVIINLIHIVILILNWAGIGEQVEILGTILRTLRIGRVFRLIKKQENL